MDDTSSRYPTSLGVSTRETISLFGEDLATELIGHVDFGALTFRLLTMRQPTDDEAAVFNAVLVALADHGFTPTTIAARLTLLGAPEALQGAVAAGLLGAGSRFLGVTEDTGRFLSDALETQARAGLALPADEAGWDDLAQTVVEQANTSTRMVPGLGHHLHKDGDPRVPPLFDLARQHGTWGMHLSLFAAVGRIGPRILGRSLPMNAAGAAGAILADLGVRPELLRGVALLARCAGILGHLAEELRSPVAPAIFDHVESSALFVRPEPDPSSTDIVDRGLAH